MRSGKSISKSAPVHTILAQLRKPQHATRLHDVDRTLDAALSTLELLDPCMGLDQPNATAARDAVSDLLTALRNTAPGTDDATVRAIETTIHDPKALVHDIRHACYKFVCDTARRRRRDVATFSLILFRSTDHGGAIAASFKSERAQWMDVLHPASPHDADEHLAVIPPPDAIAGIDLLAGRLGIADLVPCVAFLGDDFPPELPGLARSPEQPSYVEEIAQRLACFPLARHSSGYPARLREIYRTVYAHGALWPGEQLAGAMDKVISKVNVWALLKLLAGAFVGKSGAGAVEGAERIIKPGSR